MTQKPPKFTGTVDLDAEDGHLPEQEHEHDLGSHDLGPDEYADTGADDDIDLEAEMEARKRRGKLIFYAATVLGIGLVGFVGYVQFAPLFHHNTTTLAAKAPTTPLPSAQSGIKSAGNNTPPTVTAPAQAPVQAASGQPAASPDAAGIASAPDQAAAIVPNTPATETAPVAPAPPPGIDAAAIANLPKPVIATPAPTPAVPNSAPTVAAVVPAVSPVAKVPTAAAPAAVAQQPSPAQAQLPAITAGDKPTPVVTQAVKPVAPASLTPAPVVPAAVTTPAATATRPAATVATVASDPRIDDLAAKVASLQSSQKVTATQLQQIQASLDALQKQISQGGSTPAAVRKPTPSVRVRRAQPRDMIDSAQVVTSSRPARGWVLRSATPGGALLGHSSTGDLQRVAVGDVVNGLGRITYIGEQNGRWIVQGSNGSVRQ